MFVDHSISSESVFDIAEMSCQEFLESFNCYPDFYQSFIQKYSYIIAYHGTNLDKEEIASIKKVGLKVPNPKFLLEKAKHKLILNTDSNEFKSQLIKEIDLFFEKPPFDTDQGVFLCIDRESLLEFDYHYLFGSEYLQNLAERLKMKFGVPFKNRLADSGKSALIKAKVPVDQVDSLSVEIIYDYWWGIDENECSILLKKGVTKDMILEIEEVPRPYDKYNMLLG
ncbi:hypothetical protein [Flammeovirga aprica]|uniref:Uncharacterized protein n=1 Tax=Flammeovirga aprica JL-4 TaxID=694437 RepID=A0A7X9RRX2_9BACT|nr:hypothetical protein [Flammeovirga aprica]NME66600.1 hypothetical protein [Flammeovirga aprica JL-4]